MDGGHLYLAGHLLDGVLVGFCPGIRMGPDLVWGGGVTFARAYLHHDEVLLGHLDGGLPASMGLLT